jgi:hypothetical protein
VHPHFQIFHLQTQPFQIDFPGFCMKRHRVDQHSIHIEKEGKARLGVVHRDEDSTRAPLPNAPQTL